MTAFHPPSTPRRPLMNGTSRALSAAAVVIFGTAWLSFGTPAVAEDINPGALTGIFEPSGLKQLPDGRILVVEDEAEHAFALLEFQPDSGTPVTDAAANQRLIDSFERKMNDLEGLAQDGRGWLYAVTSHSSNKKGERKQDREQLVRFRLSEGRAVDQRYHDSLRDQLSDAAALKQLVANIQGPNRPDLGMINIEGLAFDTKHKRLMLGLSKPVFDGKALIVTLTNPDAVFEQQAAPAFGDTYLIDLQGGGIRSIEYDAARDQYLLINEVENADGKNRSQLWRWKADARSAPKRITPPAFAQMKNVEAVGLIEAGNGPEYLFLSDEGNVKKARTGQYLRVPADRLKNGL